MDSVVKLTLRKTLPEELFRDALIQDYLTDHLKDHPLDPATFDLHPKQRINESCQSIADLVRHDLISCSKEDVMLAWLKMVLLDYVWCINDDRW